ncbi:MAG TPA: hypothetical protein VI136_01195 [Verrucomicrobiae bacterium]
MRTLGGGVIALALLCGAGACGGSDRTGPPWVALDKVPPSGNFYSMQRTEQPPLPFCPFPGADLFMVGANTYLYNDLDVDYVTLEQEAMTRDLLNKAGSGRLTVSSGVPTPPGAGGGGSGGDPGSGDPPIANDYPPDALWLEIYRVTNDLAYLTVHGTHAGVEYQLQRRPSLDVTASWSGELQFDGEEGDTVLDPVPLQGRPLSFFRVATCGVVAFEQMVTTGAGQAVVIPLCVTNPCGEPAITVQTWPAQGTLTGTGLTRTYTPTNAAFVGTDSFTYTADGVGSAVTIDVLASPLLITSCRENRILLHWTLPDGYAPHGFKVYRCAGGPGCTPGEGDLLATVFTPGNSFPRDYTDTNNLQSGVTYCYRVKLLVYQDVCNPVVYYDSGFSNTSCSGLCTPPNVRITGNCSADFPPTAGPIQTLDYTNGTLVSTFVPQHAGNGRGLATHGTEIFYTRKSDDSIHVCLSGATTDLRTLTNRWRPDVASAGLTFHSNYLYALTGYERAGSDPGESPIVFKLNPVTGDVLASVTIANATNGGFARRDSDGFTVLPSGNFLVNDGDGYEGYVQYHEYYGSGPQAGNLVPGGLTVDLGQYGFIQGRGVAIAPDGQSLYFIAGSQIAEEADMIVRTDLSGILIGFQPITPMTIEDIEVTLP